MTVSTTDNTVIYRGNGAATEFAVPFKITDEDNLVVYRRVYATGEHHYTYSGTEYSYSGIGDDAGTLTLAGAALDDDYELVIQRIVPYTQELHIVNVGGFYPDTVEAQLDLMVMGLQQLGDQVSRSVRFSLGHEADELIVTDGEGMFIGLDADLNPILLSGTGTDGALRTDLAASSGSSLLGYSATAGTTSTTVQAMLRRITWVTEYGATGDGTTDDTAAIQAAIDAAGTGGTVAFEPDKVYRIHTNVNPTQTTQGGIKLVDGVTLLLNGCELKALKSDNGAGSVIQSYHVDGWRIEGPGTITGEWDLHTGSSGENGNGITVFTSNDWVIGPGITIWNTWGDGIYVGSSQADPGSYSENWLIDSPHIHTIGRNGISVVAAKNFEIRSPHIHNVTRTAPRTGIDFEPDNGAYPNENGQVTNPNIYDCQSGGVAIVKANTNIQVTGGRLEAGNHGLNIGNNANQCRVIGTKIVNNNPTNASGTAIRVTASSPSSIVNFVVSDCEIRGGAGTGASPRGYTVDIPSGADIEITDCNVHTIGAGVPGIARIAGAPVKFRNNRCTIEVGSGDAAFAWLDIASGVTLGGNIYKNLSAVTPLNAVISTGIVWLADDYAVSPLPWFTGISGLLGPFGRRGITTRGDADASVTPRVQSNTQVWSAPLTANRAVTLDVSSSIRGDRLRVVRTAASTGAFSLNVGTGPLKALATGQWCEVEYDGSAWVLIAYGSL